MILDKENMVNVMVPMGWAPEILDNHSKVYPQKYWHMFVQTWFQWLYLTTAF